MNRVAMVWVGDGIMDTITGAWAWAKRPVGRFFRCSIASRRGQNRLEYAILTETRPNPSRRIPFSGLCTAWCVTAREGTDERPAMIIVLKPHPTPEVVQHVLERIEALGLTPHLSQGVARTIIGVIGDEEKLQVAAAAGDPGRRAGVPILKPFKLASREFHQDDSGDRGQGSDDRRRPPGDDRRPVRRSRASRCSMEIAGRVKEAGANILRGGAFKPRTSPYSFQGLGEEGLKILRDVGEQARHAGRHRGHGPAAGRAGRAVRRHVPDRRPQHAELRPAQGGRPDAASRCCSSAA